MYQIDKVATDPIWQFGQGRLLAFFFIIIIFFLIFPVIIHAMAVHIQKFQMVAVIVVIVLVRFTERELDKFRAAIERSRNNLVRGNDSVQFVLDVEKLV